MSASSPLPPTRNTSHHREAPFGPSLPSREPSVTRGRPLTTSARTVSPPSQTPVVLVPSSNSSPDQSIERNPSLSYGHHRQTSIVHGIKHSRNTSFVNSPATSPLSPQVLSASGTVPLDGPAMSQESITEAFTTNGTQPAGNAAAGGYTGAGASNDGSVPHASTTRKPERMQSGRSSRKGHHHHRSQSRHHQQPQEPKTVVEYALYHLFTSFVDQANQKISQCLTDRGQPEARVERVCGPGVDPVFDQLISAFGHIARHKPKPLIDTIMLWRKGKSEEAASKRVLLANARQATSLPPSVLPRRNTEPVQSPADGQSATSSASGPEQMVALQQTVIQAEQRSTVSTYLICRVLIEIITQTDLNCLTMEMADRLLNLFYTQLNAVDPDQVEESPLNHANWVIYAQLLGVLSELVFDNVQDKFLADLRLVDSQFAVKGQFNRDLETKGALLVRGMRYLHVRTYPEDAWDRTCDFMHSLAKLFANVHGQTIKYAYCQVLRELLLRIASSAAIQLSMPKWRMVVETMKPRLSLLLSKPKHWHEAFPLMSALLCVSPTETFMSQWMSLALSTQPRLKERATRAIALRGICQLVWTYLYRTNTDPPNVAVRRLEDIVRMVFQSGKRSYLSTETTIAEPFIQLARMIGFRYQELCFRIIIFPLLNSELFASGRELRVENLEPDRMVIGIRSFLAIMGDLEKGEQPPFPSTFDSDSFGESAELPSMLMSARSIHHLPTKSSLLKEDRLSRPVNFTGFAEIAKEYYVRFCKILGEITIICDNTFGGQAVLDEKFSLSTPKTPMSDAFSFSRRDDHQASIDPRQGFYDLLHVAVQALPRFLSPHIPFNSLINLLCTGTAHVQRNIASSSAQSLKSIARQSHAQQVTIGFARFIFNFDDRYATMSDGGMLGPGHIESTLKLYVELLQIWIEEIKQKTRKAALDTPDDGVSGNRGVHLDLSSVWAHVDEVESHGLFFLCSPSRRVRAYAVTVLRLVTEFDTALGGLSTRVIRVMEGSPQKVMEISDDKLSLAERSRLQRGMRKSNVQSTLVELCSSDVPYDSTLWFKIFPNLVRISFEVCPFAVTLTRDIVCARLTQMHRTLLSLIEGPRASPYSAFDPNAGKISGRLATTSPEIIIEQWKLYLIFAFTTLTNLGSGGQVSLHSQVGQHSRKSSKSSQKSTNKVYTASELFTKVLPFLHVDHVAVRDAAVIGLGSININLYRTLLESLQGHVAACAEEAKTRLGTHTRNVSSPRRHRRTDHLRTEITHVYKLTSHFLKMPEAYNDEWILNNLINYTKDLRIFLSDAEVQHEWEFQKLRTHYCGLVEILFEGINRTNDPLQWMPFQARKAAFTLMEDWCGYSPNQTQVQEREEHMRRSILDREGEFSNKGIATAAMEIEKRDLRTAALSAMATLCGGPVSITTDSKVLLQFDVRRMLSWIQGIFNTLSDRSHAIGRRALTNLIVHNREHPYLLECAMEECFVSSSSKALESYFEVVTRVLTDREDYSLPFWKVLSAGLYTLGLENNELRMKSVRLLRTLEAREQKNSKLQDLDISISDKTIAVYKLAQFETSRRLANQHSELAFLVFSQFCKYFIKSQPDQQRNMVAAMLPWVQTIELQVNPEGGPTAHSYMLLVNLFEITVKCSNALHNEIQALWQALATGPYAGNVQLILNFFINLCLDKREQNYVDFSKQIVVHLSSTPAGLKVVEFLLLQINPRSMVVEKREPTPPPPDAAYLPYLADLPTLLPSSGNKHNGFALGQVCLILLVDLMVSPIQLSGEQVPLLLQVVLVLWDHYIPVVQDQAREMIVHLIHELVISKMDDEATGIDKRSIEDFIESVRQHDPKVVWNYDDKNGNITEDSGTKVPESMNYVAGEVLRFFSLAYPGFRETWGKVTLTWATSCPVRHLACRSFQLFRCILSSLDQQMLSDMLARLSNTISDDESDIQTFSMEILTTLRSIIEALQPEDLLQYPQLFWTTCACLDTIHEGEFMESMLMLDKFLDKIDMSDPAVIRILEENCPEKWEGHFEGLAQLIYKGVRSSLCVDRSLRILERLVVLPSSRIVGDEGRLVYTVLANMPRFLRSFDPASRGVSVTASAEVLARVAEDFNCTDLSQALTAFAHARYRSSKDFVAQTISAIRSSFFPDLEYGCLVFLLSLLQNKIEWIKANTMEVLCTIIPEIEMRKPEIITKFPDLISPLLRLLHTEFCPRALRVLDFIMHMTGPATPLEKQHLRMSIAGSQSSRAFKKQYEKTQSIYGIPEESGWSIPVPAHHSHLTRANVHAVFYTCGNIDEADAAQVTTPKIEFRQEEFPFSPMSDYRTATMTSEDTRGDSHIGELVMKLGSLDDFFEDDDDTETLTDLPNSAMFTNGRYANSSYSSIPSSVDVREDIYDQQTAPILHKSLARNASVTSFQSGYSDLKLSPARDPGVMTPAAFSTFTSAPMAAAAPQPGAIPGRPGLHSRSVTSPSAPNQHQRLSPALTSALVDENGEPFSDDDLAIGRSNTSAVSDKTYNLEHMKPLSQDTRSRIRSGIRRLTGGGGDAKEREKTREAIKQALQKSPQVPKVPDIYLVNPKSADP